MPISFLVDPRKQQISPWMGEDGQPLTLVDSPVKRAEIDGERVRKLCESLGIPLHKVPVIHRRNQKHVRYWNLTRGKVGNGVLAVLLADSEWRFTTPEEVKAYEDKCQHDRVAYARRKLRIDESAAKMVAAQSSLGMLVDAAYQPEESLEELNPEEIDKLQKRLDELKVKKAGGVAAEAQPVGGAGMEPVGVSSEPVGEDVKLGDVVKAKPKPPPGKKINGESIK